MLTQWKRHSRTCLARLQANKKIPKDEIRFFKQCRCACWVTGVHPLTQEYIKKTLGTSSWEVGEQRLALMQMQPVAQASDGIDPITVRHALDAWIREQERLQIASTTIANYNSLEKAILTFCESRGLRLLRQLNYERTYEMVLSWKDLAPATAKQRLGRLRALFKFAMTQKWLTENPALLIKAPRQTRETVDPLEDDDLEKIEVALDTWTDDRKLRGGLWSLRPATFKCLVHVLKDTGLRISDAQKVRPAIIELLPDGSGVATFIQTKRDYAPGGQVTVYLQASTIEEMQRVPWLSKKYPFLLECPDESNRNLFKEHLRRQAGKVYMALQAVGRQAGIAGSCRAHRFRHAFAVDKLKRGWHLEDVSHLLGHSQIEITHKHYAKWTRSRQRLLQQQVLADWEKQKKVIEFKRA